MNMNEAPVVVIISAHSEWRAVREEFATVPALVGPYGEWFETGIRNQRVFFMHGGWGKIAAAGSAQWALAQWQPRLVINLGTCGGLAGQVERGAVVLATETLVYDIVEQMGDAQAAIDHYATHMDLSWLREPYPMAVIPARLVSADRDIVAEEVNWLREQYGALAADWESGAIAWVCSRNGTRCLILRGVSDLVSAAGGEAYGKPQVFHDGTRRVMQTLLAALPGWLACAGLNAA